MHKIYSIILLVFVPIMLRGYTIDHTLSDLSFYKDHGYDRIKALKFALWGNPGAPELPVINLHYIIPANSHAESLIISQINIAQIAGSYCIYPAQPAGIPGESIPWVEPDTVIYNSDSLFPKSFIESRIRGSWMAAGS